MEAIRCSRGHYYDKALGACPVCAREGREQNFGSFGSYPMGQDDIPATAPATGFGEAGIPGETVPETAPGFSATDFIPTTPGGQGGWKIDNYEPTAPSSMGAGEGYDPVVGWLVCISGPNRGKSYQLHGGTNFIGSNKEMDVCLENDNTISHRNAATISYDDMDKSFFIQKGQAARNLIYLNGRSVRSDSNLAMYDRIQIGATDLMFIPLCGEKFSWQDV